jgi:hypothetical protein
MAHKVGRTTGYGGGHERLLVPQHTSGMLRLRPPRLRTGSTTLRVQRPRRRH